MARSGNAPTAIQYVLNRKVDFIALSLASNLDAIGQSTQRTVCPTRPAILWNVLIETVRQVRDTVNVSPRKVIGKILFANVRVGKRRGIIIPNLVVFHNLQDYNKGKTASGYT
jgi:hypothetical protein